MQKVSFTSGGEKYELAESNNLVAVRTTKDKTLTDALQSDSSKAIASKLKVKQQVKKANVTILEVKKSQKDPLEVRNKARKS